jgi:hypothetical protein
LENKLQRELLVATNYIQTVAAVYSLSLPSLLAGLALIFGDAARKPSSIFELAFFSSLALLSTFQENPFRLNQMETMSTSEILVQIVVS